MSLGFGFGFPRKSSAGGGSGVGAALALAFSSSSTLDSRVTFSRGSNATMMGTNGYLQYAPNNLLTYSQQFENAAWTKSNSSIEQNLLAYSQAFDNAAWIPVTAFIQTNLLTYSQQFDNAAWTKSNSFVQSNLLLYSEQIDNAAWFNASTGTVTVTANSVAAPDGTLTADTLTGSATNIPQLTQNAVLSAAAYTFSFYARADSTQNLSAFEGSTSLGTAALTTSWQRFSFTWTPTAGTKQIGWRLTNNQVVYIWGAQLVQGSVAGDYRATTSASLPVLYSDPFGGVAAEKLSETTAASSTHLLLGTSDVSTTSGASYTLSLYAKAGERSWFQLQEGSSVTAGAYFNLASGTVGTVSGTGSPTASIQSIGSGWYRCTLTFTAGTLTRLRAYMATGDNGATYTGDGSSGIYVYGAQLVQGSAAGDYQQTVASTSPVYYTAPDGTRTGELLVGTAAGERTQQYSLTANSPTMTLSAYVKAPSGGTGVTLLIYNTTTVVTAGACQFSGATFSPGSANGTSVAVANGWYRVSVTVSSGITVGNGLAVYIYTDNQTGGGTPLSSVYLWGAQLVPGIVAGNYQQTGSAAVQTYYTAPDGTQTAEKLTENTATAIHYVFNTHSSIAANTRFTSSVYAKAGERSSLFIELDSGVIGSFNLVTATSSTSTYGTGVALGSSITSVGNGWYRCSVSGYSTGGVQNNVLIETSNGGAYGPYAGDGYSGIYIWGSQLEIVTTGQGTAPSTYTSTTAKNMLGYSELFDNAAWTKSASSIQNNLLTYSQQFDNAAWNKNNSFVQTNLFLYSQDFTNAAWAKSFSSIVANSAIAPDGTTTASSFVEDSTNSVAHSIFESVSKAASAITYTYTLYVKAAGRSWFSIALFDGASVGTRFWYNVATGTVGSTSAIGAGFTNNSYSITAVGNGWYRCIATSTTNTVAAIQAYNYSTDADGAIGPTIALNGVGLYIWGAQLVQGSVPGDYRATTSAALPVLYQDPFSGTQAEKLCENTANLVHQLSVSQTLATNTYTYSFYAKAGERTKLQVSITDNVTVAALATVDVANQLITSSSFSSQSITNVGNGWCRCSFTRPITTGSTTVSDINLINAGGSNVYTGDGSSGLYIYGAQFVVGTTAGDYTQTIASSLPVKYAGPIANTYGEKLYEDTTTAQHYVLEDTTLSINMSYTHSVYAKAAERSVLQLTGSTGFNASYVNFDLASGRVSASDVGTYSMTSVGNGWYRCSLTLPATASGAGRIVMAVGDSPSYLRLAAYTGTGYSGILIADAQLTQTPYLTDYVANYSAATSSVAYYGARLEGDASTLAYQNLALQSQTFTDATWTKLALTANGAAGTAPDGTSTATSIIESVSAAVQHQIQQAVTLTAATYTLSVYAKLGPGSQRWLSLYPQGTGVAAIALFDLTTGVVTATGGAQYLSSGSTSVGNGWFRLYLTFTAAAVSVLNVMYLSNSSSSAAPGYAGDGVSGAYIWGAQLNLGATALPYTATTTQALTQYGNYTAQNLLLYSEQFDNAVWIKQVGSSVIPNTTIAPDGTLTADTLVRTTGFEDYQNFSAVSGVAYTFSLWIRSDSAMTARIKLGRASNNPMVTTTCPLTTSWQRFSVTFISDVTNTGFADIDTTTAGSIQVWGAQLSATVSPLPYTATTSSTITTLAGKGLLIEEQRTNLTTYSEAFNDASWLKARCTISADTAVAPDGATTADTLVEDTTANSHPVYKSVSGITTIAYTLSVYAKANVRNQVNLAFSNTAFPTGPYGTYDLTTLVATGFLGASASIVPVGNGWYRCVLTATATSAGTADCYIQPMLAGAPNYLGTGANALYLWGAQLEAGAFATSYIPTTSATATRNADSAYMAGANFYSWYNQPAGTFYAQFDLLAAPLGTGNKGVYAAYGSATNNIISYAANSTGNLADVVAENGATQAALTSVAALYANATYKDAFAYAANNFGRSLNGATPQTDSLGSVPVGIYTLRIGWDDTGTPTLNGHIQNLNYYPYTYSASALQGITA